MHVKLNEKRYKVHHASVDEKCEFYWRKGRLYNDRPKGYDIRGYIICEDFGKVGIMERTPRVVYIVLIFFMCSIAGLVFAVGLSYYLKHIDTPDDVLTFSNCVKAEYVVTPGGGVKVVEEKNKPTSIYYRFTYNRSCFLYRDKLDMGFHATAGNYLVYVTGDGVISKVERIHEGESVEYLSIDIADRASTPNYLMLHIESKNLCRNYVLSVASKMLPKPDYKEVTYTPEEGFVEVSRDIPLQEGDTVKGLASEGKCIRVNNKRVLDMHLGTVVGFEWMDEFSYPFMLTFTLNSDMCANVDDISPFTGTAQTNYFIAVKEDSGYRILIPLDNISSDKLLEFQDGKVIKSTTPLYLNVDGHEIFGPINQNLHALIAY